MLLINIVLMLVAVCYTAEASRNFISNEESSDSSLPLEAINNTGNFRMHGKKGKDKWFNGQEMRYIYCVKPLDGKCEEIKSKQCLGTNLPYQSTTLNLTSSYSQEESFELLYSYQALRHVPKCWAVIQPFLCAVFLPKCELINGTSYVYLPSLEMCKITMEPCRIMYNTSYFPDFLKCNENRFPSKCNNDVREMKFNLTGQCLKPLVHTDSVGDYYKEIEGCGIQCKDPLYSDDEHRQIHKLIGWGASICITFNVFALATFFIDWHNGNQWPGLIIFYVNFCFMISCFGWLAQFLPGGREDIVCRKDGTLKHSEPSGGENLSCIIVFILVYYFLIAAMCWFVIFTYAWHMSFKAIGKIQERIDKKASYFHLMAWSLPLILTITTMAFSEIDGNSTVGICFVGYLNHPMRGGFLLGPIVCVLFVGGYFLGRGMIILIKLKISSKQIISSRASKKIRQSIVRMGICSIITFILIMVTIFCHVNEFSNRHSWAFELRSYIICRISSTFTDESVTCKMADRPSLSMLQLHLLSLFAFGLLMSSFVFTPSTVHIWGRYFRRKCGKDEEEPLKLQKHKVIAQAFAKRKEFQNQGRLSISFHNSHTDPVGLKFDMNSAIGSHDFSSNWANNLPRFVNRRYALTGATSSSYGPRKNSVDSEISFSVRHVSVESRRNSIDSQVSVKIAEMKTKVASRSRSGKSKNRHHSSRHNRRDFTASRRYSRKESSTSVESQVITAIQNGRRSTSGASGVGGLLVPMAGSKRRAGITEINELIAKNKFMMPFLNSTTSSENLQMGNMNVQDSKIDIILKQIGLSEHKIHDNNVNMSISQENIVTCEAFEMRNKLQAVMDYSDSHSSVEEGALALVGRTSKNNSIKSASSKKSNKHSTSRLRKTRKTSRSISKSAPRHDVRKENKAIEDSQENLNSSFASFNSELFPMTDLNMQSSQSGVSVTNSRNSKKSVDVGIQTNPHEIAKQTFSSFEFHEKALKNEENEDIYTENHKLLPKKSNSRIIATQTSKKSETSLSETEKLKLLLLPSK